MGYGVPSNPPWRLLPFLIRSTASFSASHSPLLPVLNYHSWDKPIPSVHGWPETISSVMMYKNYLTRQRRELKYWEGGRLGVGEEVDTGSDGEVPKDWRNQWWMTCKRTSLLLYRTKRWLYACRWRNVCYRLSIRIDKEINLSMVHFSINIYKETALYATDTSISHSSEFLFCSPQQEGHKSIGNGKLVNSRGWGYYWRKTYGRNWDLCVLVHASLVEGVCSAQKHQF